MGGTGVSESKKDDQHHRHTDGSTHRIIHTPCVEPPGDGLRVVRLHGLGALPRGVLLQLFGRLVVGCWGWVEKGVKSKSVKRLSV